MKWAVVNDLSGVLRQAVTKRWISGTKCLEAWLYWKLKLTIRCSENSTSAAFAVPGQLVKRISTSLAFQNYQLHQTFPYPCQQLNWSVASWQAMQLRIKMVHDVGNVNLHIFCKIMKHTLHPYQISQKCSLASKPRVGSERESSSTPWNITYSWKPDWFRLKICAHLSASWHGICSSRF